MTTVDNSLALTTAKSQASPIILVSPESNQDKYFTPYLIKNKRGYYEVHQHYRDASGKLRHRFLRYLGKDPRPFQRDLADLPHLLINKGGLP